MTESTGSGDLGKSVAIIGAGALGLVATKNLAEEGFSVATFEKNNYIGGLWNVTQDPSETSVLEGTVSNVSKQGSAFTDFPMPDSYPTHPTAQQMKQYFEDYADHFQLRRYIRLSTLVTSISRIDCDNKWSLTFNLNDASIQTSESQSFDRLIIATGPHSKAYIPQVKGIANFRGEILHSQAFKNPSKYKDKTVLVVGISNSAADSISFLIKASAKRIYVSHRRNFRTVPRIVDGKALDHILTLRMQIIASWVQWLAPAMQATMMTKMMTKFQDQEFPGLKCHPSQDSRRDLPPDGEFVPAISEDLARNLMIGGVESVQAIQEVSAATSVKLIGGEELHNIDVILFCTGLHPDLASMLPDSANPCNPAHAPELYAPLPAHYTDRRRVYRMYRGFLSLQYKHSLAFMGATLMIRAAFPFYDLVTMALAQLWSGKYPMPNDEEMRVNADAHLKRLARIINDKGDVQHPGSMRQVELDQWLQKVAGTNLYESVGNFSIKAWSLWWNDPVLYQALIDGPVSGHALRLFESTGRKSWAGARQAILKANEEAQDLKRLYVFAKTAHERG